MELTEEQLAKLTPLDTSEICQLFDGENNSPYPYCMLANDLGVVAYTQKDQTAQKKLRELLQIEKLNQVDDSNECGNCEEDVKFVSYCWLCCLQEKTKENSEALDQFVKNPANEQMISRAKKNYKITFIA